MTRCPIYPNHNLDKNGHCKRSHLCTMENLLKCGAVSSVAVRKRKIIEKQNNCAHRETKLIGTDRYIMLDGVEKRIFRAICIKCEFEKEIVM